MRLTHPDGTPVHLAYCTNVHPTQDVEALLGQIRRFGAGARARLGTARLGLGLWLPAPVVARLAGRDDRDSTDSTDGTDGTDGTELDRLKAALAENGLEVVTLNAFPYQGFHAPRVKKAVYRPDWSEPERLAYTLDCARLLARLMPADVRRGSVSTLPLGWRAGWDAERHRRARHHLDQLAEGLAAIEAETGRTIRVGLEPEPGCVVETTRDAAEHLTGLDTERIGICLDACHLAVGFEEPREALGRLADAGLSVVKAQASAALHVASPGEPRSRVALTGYAEDRFLHQVREAAEGRVTGRDDLPEALAGGRALPGNGPWRVHFHVPVHQRPAPPLAVTQDHLADTLRALLGGPRPVTDHIEVETYTWSVLPAARRPRDDAGLTNGLAAELRWVADRLAESGLKEQ